MTSSGTVDCQLTTSPTDLTPDPDRKCCVAGPGETKRCVYTSGCGTGLSFRLLKEVLTDVPGADPAPDAREVDGVLSPTHSSFSAGWSSHPGAQSSGVDVYFSHDSFAKVFFNDNATPICGNFTEDLGENALDCPHDFAREPACDRDGVCETSDFVVPPGGWTVTVSEPLGATVAITLPAGAYPGTLLKALERKLNENPSLAQPYSVTVDDVTGKVKLHADPDAVSYTWTSTGLRDALGFVGNLSGSLTYTASVGTWGLENGTVCPSDCPNPTYPDRDAEYSELVSGLTLPELCTEADPCDPFVDQPPVMSTPPSRTVEATGPGGVSVNHNIVATDREDQQPTVFCSPRSGATFPIGTTNGACLAVDSSGQTAGPSAFTITVEDVRLTVPANIVIAQNVTAGATVDYAVSAVRTYADPIVDGTVADPDSCSPSTPPAPPSGAAVHLSCTVAGAGDYVAGGTFPVGTTTVTCSGWANNEDATTEKTFTVTVTQTAPVVGETTGLPTAPVALVPGGTTLTGSASFTDDTASTHTCSFSWGGATEGGTVTETAGSGSCTDGHTFTEPGVYSVTVTVTDQFGVSTTNAPVLVVIYDASGGYVTGGGWITSPAGALVRSPAATGRASFGFVAKYKQGATVPSGNTEFVFQTGGFRLSSTSYQWLVVGGPVAQYKGDGVEQGSSEVLEFLLTAKDGQVTGGGGVDRLRLKVWVKATGDVVYDTGSDLAIDSGNIAIHK